MSRRKVALLPGADALSVHCQFCGCRVGESCRLRGSMWDVEPHAARIKLANDRRTAEPEPEPER